MTSVAGGGSGLTEDEAARRLKLEGPNELPKARRRTPLRVFAEVIREPMFALLVASGAIYLALGDLGEAAVLSGFAMLSIAIAVVQEARTERVLEALRDLASPRALVIRDGVRRRIAGRETVRGDLVVLSEGDRVPADGRLLSAVDLLVDESLLTGESAPVRKTASVGPQPDVRPGGDDLPAVFAGTLVVRGHGAAETTATGARSEIGRIGASLGAIDPEPPALRRQTRRLVRAAAAIGLAVSALAIVLHGTLRGDWLGAALNGLAIGMSMLPEEFPLVLTVFMAMGAWRLSQARVLVRRAAAIEALGAATVLCTDKTGTLTVNRMEIAELRTAAGRWRPSRDAQPGAVSAAARRVIEIGRLASAPEPVDPMETAFRDLARDVAGFAPEAAGGRLVRAYGLRPELLAIVHVWRLGEGAGLTIAAKGAVEAVARLCRFDDDAARQARSEADDMASRGMRVLAVARATAASEGGLPADPLGFRFEWLGLVGLSDPLRPSAGPAVAECRAAGVRVVMITGDYPATAVAIARQAGIDAGRVLSGPDLDRMGDAELAANAATTGVFARISPRQKLRIVEALKASGETVAMTGDGVNDAPALAAAHIGIAMGGRGADVAREAAAIVLLDDDFGSIVRTIRLGRRIHDNLRKAMGFILAVHVPIAGLALLPLALGLPAVLGPLHIAFLEMVIDPICSIAFEAEREEDDVMARPPRRADSPLLPPSAILWSLLQGALGFAAVAAIYLAATARGMPEDEVRALSVVSLALVNAALVLANRSFSASVARLLGGANPALWSVAAAAGGALAVVLVWPPARAVFRFGPLHADDLVVCVAAGVAVLCVVDLAKPWWRRATGA